MLQIKEMPQIKRNAAGNKTNDAHKNARMEVDYWGLSCQEAGQRNSFREEIYHSIDFTSESIDVTL